MTDVPDLVWVAVVASIGNSNHSSLSAVILTAQVVPNLSVSRKVFLKCQVNWIIICGAIQDLPWHNNWLANNPVEVLIEHLSLLFGHYVPTKVIHVLNKNKPWFDDQCRRLIFGGPVITLGLTGKSLSTVKSELMNPTQNPRVSLVAETWMFWWMFIPLISGSPLSTLRCLVRVCHCICLLVRVVDWCVGQFVRGFAVGSFWQLAVQGGCLSATQLPSVS